MSLSASPTISPATSSIFSKFTLILIKSVEAVSVFVTPPSSWWVRWGLADSLNYTSHVKGGWNCYFDQVTLSYEKLCHIIKSPPVFRVAPASLSKEWSHDPSDFPRLLNGPSLSLPACATPPQAPSTLPSYLPALFTLLINGSKKKS